MRSRNKIGIVQGRLSSQVGATIQSFPVNTWQDEFPLAQKAGLGCIEWIYEKETEHDNPLRTDDGVKEIHRLEREWSVVTRSICADYYMTNFLINSSGKPIPSLEKHLKWLIGRASLIECNYIVLPFVDSSSLKTPDQIRGITLLLRSMIPCLEKHDVELHLETDLPPTVLLKLLESMDHNLIRSNYDIGNSASVGHDPRQELTLLKNWIGSVHVKDRILGGGTVPLGIGSADFALCFERFKLMKYKRPYILQAARDTALSEVELAIRNRKFIESYLSY